MQQSGTTLAMTASYEYDAFGNCLTGGSEAENNPFRYNGQYYDEETGLIYLRNRYYDPSTGRFTQEDPYWNVNNMIYGDKQYQEGETKIPDYSAIVQSSNLYVYCMNDPVNLSDLLGMVAGDLFNNLDELALDWAWNYAGITNYTGSEQTSLIYMYYNEETLEVSYSYTCVNNGTPKNSDPEALWMHIPDGAEKVGAIHSHPYTKDFSSDDFDLAVDKEYKVMFVVGPDYGDGRVNVRKLQDYGDGSGYHASTVSYSTGYRMISIGEQREADKKYKNIWRYYYDDIMYYLKIKETNKYEPVFDF